MWLVARAPSQRLLAARIAGLAGVVDEAELSLRTEDRLIDLRDHPLQRDFWWGSAAFEAEFGPLDINDILEPHLRRPRHRRRLQPPGTTPGAPPAGLGRTVLLVHETDGADKRWPVRALGRGRPPCSAPMATTSLR